MAFYKWTARAFHPNLTKGWIFIMKGPVSPAYDTNEKRRLTRIITIKLKVGVVKGVARVKYLQHSPPSYFLGRHPCTVMMSRGSILKRFNTQNVDFSHD